jgi:hypothetical protein
MAHGAKHAEYTASFFSFNSMPLLLANALRCAYVKLHVTRPAPEL